MDRNSIIFGTRAVSQEHAIDFTWIWLREKNLIRKISPFGEFAKDQDAYIFLQRTKYKYFVREFHCRIGSWTQTMSSLLRALKSSNPSSALDLPSKTLGMGPSQVPQVTLRAPWVKNHWFKGKVIPGA